MIKHQHENCETHEIYAGGKKREKNTWAISKLSAFTQTQKEKYCKAFSVARKRNKKTCRGCSNFFLKFRDKNARKKFFRDYSKSCMLKVCKNLLNKKQFPSNNIKIKKKGQQQEFYSETYHIKHK